MVDGNVLDQFVKAIKPNDKTKNNVYSAVVSKIDTEGTVWVYVAGSDKETPVSSVSTEVKQGDAVNVEWRNNKLFISGNYSNPAAGTNRVLSVERDAQRANTAANAAVQSAFEAGEAAGKAIEDAAKAEQAAGDAQTSADTAITAANKSLVGLSQVESVVDVLNWITEHGSYVKTTDTSIQPNKTYYTITATQVAEPSDEDVDSQGVLIYYELVSGAYVRTTDASVVSGKTYYTVTGTPVGTPSTEQIGTYYELNVSEALSNYVSTHLALTNDGLYVMRDGNGYKFLVTNFGAYVLDPDNVIISSFTGEGVTVGYDGLAQTIMTDEGIEFWSPEGVVIGRVHSTATTFIAQKTEKYPMRSYECSSSEPSLIFSRTIPIDIHYLPIILNDTHPLNVVNWVFPSGAGGISIVATHSSGSTRNFSTTLAEDVSTRIVNTLYDYGTEGSESKIFLLYSVVSGVKLNIGRVKVTLVYSLNQNGELSGNISVDIIISTNNLANHGYTFKSIGGYLKHYRDVQYYTSTGKAPEYLFGTKSTEEGSGPFAFQAGQDVYADGANHMAIGKGVSTYENDGTEASSSGDTKMALGWYNDLAIPEAMGDALLVIGNGADDTNRSNAFAIGEDGAIYLGLDINAATGTDDGDIYAALVGLDWEDCIV